MSTATKEWRTDDKSEWGDGPWQDEPDKVQWVDEETGLDCLIVRGPVGALCGYVGVPPEHPWHGLGYDHCVRGEECEDEFCYGHSPDGQVRVHGGLTFAAPCQDAYTREEWEEKRREPKWTKYMEQRGYPEDPTYEEYVTWAQSKAICHIPEPGRPDEVWWFGFDCAHSGDGCPKYDNVRSLRGVYRSRGYVERECRKLAQQLAEVSP